MSQGESEPRGAAAAQDLLILADVLDDIEKAKVAVGNRHQALITPPSEGLKGGWYGKGIDPAAPQAVLVVALRDQLANVEHQATLALQRAMRAHPLGPWVKSTIGLGEKQVARYLAAVGDPAERRTVSQLWAYSGLHVVNGEAAQRRKGVKANWSTLAKTRAYLIATSCLKQRRSPYRKVYDDRRSHTAITHPDWTDGHSHFDAMRVMSKAIVRDIWIESRRERRRAGDRVMTEAVVCPLCVQWRCEKCKSQDWPDCCDHTTECEPFWPGGAVAQLTQNETCDYCAEAVRLMEEDHRRGRPT